MTKAHLIGLRRLGRAVRRDGARGTTARMFRMAADRLAPGSAGSDLPVRFDDVVAADVSRPPSPPRLPLAAGAPMTLNWVTTPPGRGSGGHTTMFRLVKHLEDRGHHCRVYFYDVHDSDLDYYAAIVHDYYRVTGPVADVRDGMADAHAVFASSWPTAYAVFNATSAGKRFYLVQDFEPAFHPVGAPRLLAEHTYRMGFHGITAGPWLSALLTADYGMPADPFPFGCDTEHYHVLPDPGARRDGVVFYARSDTPRRATELGLMALQVFHRRHPEVPIHLFGDPPPSVPFPVVQHGKLRPVELNELYNRCVAGLSLSMTNASLVPHEMLAAGCIPVVNDAAHNRMVLANDHVVYAEPSAHALATTLGALFEADVAGRSARELAAASSVKGSTWDAAGAAVEAVLRRELVSPPDPWDDPRPLQPRLSTANG